MFTAPLIFPLRMALGGGLQPSPVVTAFAPAIPATPPTPLIWLLRQHGKSFGLTVLPLIEVNVDPIPLLIPMPKPLLFSGGQQLMKFHPPPQIVETRFVIAGVTRDSSGAVLASCTVTLYNTATNVIVEQVTSDANGNFSFSTVGQSEMYYIVAYKAGSPDTAGTTANTLVGLNG